MGGFLSLFLSAVSLCLPWFSSTCSIVRRTELGTIMEDSSLGRKGGASPCCQVSALETTRHSLALRAQTSQRAYETWKKGMWLQV